MSEKKVDKYTFKLSDQLGKGSYGTVYKGQDTKTKEFVAIKLLPKNVINADEYLLSGLMNEIKIMQALQGQNVVRLLDVLETSNNYYIVQEFCDGGDLQGYLKKKKQLSQQEALKFFVDILMGFIELVKKGIVHRDLKPANILIHKSIYKIADFGFSKTMDNISRGMLETSVGTPLYMSPQILSSDKYTSKSDIWSLGFIFYEVLYGKTPWTGRSIPDLMKNIMTQALEFPPTTPVDPQIQDMIRCCLQREESKRISWDQLFRHKCFGAAFNYYIDGAKKLEDKAQFLVNDLRVKIMKERIDLEEIFHKYDKSGDKELSQDELTALLHQIDGNLDREEVEFIFNKIDTDGSGSIDLKEFKTWLQENQVLMSMRTQPIARRGFDRKQTFEGPLQPVSGDQYSSPPADQSVASPGYGQPPLAQPPYQPPGQGQAPYQQGQPPVQNQYAPNGMKGSTNSFQNQPTMYPPNMYGSQNQMNMPPQNQANNYGAPNQMNMKGSQNQMNQYGFQNQGNNYGQQGQPNMYGPQGQYMQGSQNQGYPNQFVQTQPNHGNQSYPPLGTQPSYNQQQPQFNYPPNMGGSQPPWTQQERAMITIQKLILAIEKYNINIWDLFKKYDKSDSATLDIREFGIMLRRIDTTLTDQDITQAFCLFDADQSGEITFQEFKEGIELNIRKLKSQQLGHQNSYGPPQGHQPYPNQYAPPYQQQPPNYPPQNQPYQNPPYQGSYPNYQPYNQGR